MSDAWLGVLVSASLIGTGIFLIQRDPAKLTGAGATPKQLRQGGFIGIAFGAMLAGFTVYLYLRGSR